MPIEKWSDNVVVVHLSSEPQFSDDLQTLEDSLANQPVDAVVDFSALKFLNSSQLARLLKLRKAMNAANSRLLLCGLDSQVWSILLVTGLDKVFECTDNVPTALATLQIA